MLSIGRSRLAFLAQVIFLSVNGVGLLLGSVYNMNTPDLYQHNVHHRFGWAVTCVACAQATLGLVRILGNQSGKKEQFSSTITKYQPLQNIRGSDYYRYSHDSGQGTEPNTPRTSSPLSRPSDTVETTTPPFDRRGGIPDETYGEKLSTFADNAAWRFFTRKLSWISRAWGTKCTNFLHGAIDRLILFLGFIALLSGWVTYGGIFVRV